MKLALVLLLAGLPLLGQAPAPPDYFVLAGTAYDRYAEVPAISGFVSFAVKLGSSNAYSYSTIEMMEKTATVRSGAAYLVKQSGNSSLLALGDAGIATGNGITLGSFSGGGVLVYDLSKRIGKGSGIHVMAGIRIRAINGASVQPVIEAGIGKSF